MDQLNWDAYGSSLATNTNTNASFWRNYQQGVEERFMISNSNPHFLNSTQGLPIKEPSTSPTGEPPTMNPPLTSFTISNDTNVARYESELLTDIPACSLESLDCLLSATNSNTDTSVEDDGSVSIILTENYPNLWNFGGNAATTTTSLDKNLPNSRKRTHELKKTEYSVFETTNLPNRGGFQTTKTDENQQKQKKPRSEKLPSSSNINFQQPSSSGSCCIDQEPDPEAIAQMKEMIYRAAAFRPVNLGLEVIEKPKRKNVRISSDPQTVAARQRRERISEKIRVLQRLVPGGSKMDTASMLDEAANYLKFLKSQIKGLENLGTKIESLDCNSNNIAFSFNPSFPIQTSSSSSSFGHFVNQYPQN